MNKAVLAISLFVLCNSAFAGVSCPETVTQLRSHMNGAIYFQTETTCLSRCKINWDTDEKKNKALSVLLAARTTDREIEFYWPDIDSCSQQNVTDASPNFINY